MKKTLLLLPLLLALAGCSSTTIVNQAPATGEVTPVATAEVPTQKVGSEMTVLDANRNTYTNYDLGFSVNIPRGSDYFAGEWISSLDGTSVVFSNQAKDNLVKFETFAVNDESEITDALVAAKFNPEDTRSKVPTSDGSFEIQLTSTGFPISPYKIWYSPTKKLLVVWNIGQDPNFMWNQAALDSQVITSFKFLP